MRATSGVDLKTDEKRSGSLKVVDPNGCGQGSKWEACMKQVRLYEAASNKQQASKQAGRQASRRAGKQKGKQARRHTSKL